MYFIVWAWIKRYSDCEWPGVQQAQSKETIIHFYPAGPFPLEEKIRTENQREQSMFDALITNSQKCDSNKSASTVKNSAELAIPHFRKWELTGISIQARIIAPA